MYILCAMLIGGLVCNYQSKPVDMRWNTSPKELAKPQAASAADQWAVCSFGIGGLEVPATVFWAFVGIPICWASGLPC
jgi:hypothetical protein